MLKQATYDVERKQFNTVESTPGSKGSDGKLQFTINIDRTSEDDPVSDASVFRRSLEALSVDPDFRKALAHGYSETPWVDGQVLIDQFDPAQRLARGAGR